jgi:hypothetical protein
MIRWYGTVLGALGFAVFHGTIAWAQGEAEKGASSGSGLLSLLLLFGIPFLFICLLVPTLRRAKQQSRHVERAIQINEETLVLARQQTTMQAETNRLLGQLVEILGRGSGYWSSHE